MKNSAAIYSSKTVAELEQELAQTSMKLSQARLAKRVGKLKNTKEVAMNQVIIARIKTILRERQLAEMAKVITPPKAVAATTKETETKTETEQN